MSDIQKNISEKLRERMRKAHSNVATRIEAEKGPYKVAMSEKSIDTFYKGSQVGSIKVSSLTEDEVNSINSDPQTYLQEALTILSEMNTDELEKTAANSAVTEETFHTITEKQLADKKVDLHPRTNEEKNIITQKQIPEAGQRPGTYDVTTEAQLRDERSTFYGDKRTADRQGEDRKSITEKQLDEGASTFGADKASDNRGEVGSVFDGGTDKQALEITEKQLQELVSHHGWEEPRTVTEDQLSGQSGELARLTAAAASTVIKQATQALAKTVLATGETPDTIAEIAKSLISHPNKYPVLAGVLTSFAKADVASIDRKIKKAKYFGKAVAASGDHNEVATAKTLVTLLSKIACDPRHCVEAVCALCETPDLVSRIDQATTAVLSETEQPKEKTAASDSIFKQVLSGEDESPLVFGDDDDGLYQYTGLLSEVNADVNDRDAFTKAATNYSAGMIKKALGREVNIEADSINVDEKKEIFTMLFKDPQKNSLEARASRRRTLSKEAQTPAGGMPPAASPMPNPAIPPSGGDMGAAPPTEALSQEPAPTPEEDAAPVGGEPKPPGSYCIACGSDDMTLDGGKWTCNTCKSKGSISWQMTADEVPGIMEDTEDKEKTEGFSLDEGLGGPEAGAPEEGLGTGTTMPNMPVAASVYRITPVVLEKLASEKVEFLKTCPHCGSHNVDLAQNEKVASTKDGICWDCFGEFCSKVVANKKDKGVYAQVMWRPKNDTCTTCTRIKEAFVKSLNNYGMDWNDFASLPSMQEQGNLILKMANAGMLNLKKAAREPLPIQKFAASSRWEEYQKFDKFPSASCLERLNRRFGENATAMSGPCKGQSLSKCVCAQLEDMGIYTDGLAAKVASRLASNNPMISNPTETCISMFVQKGYALSDSCTICDGLRAAYASAEDLIVEAVSNVNPFGDDDPDDDPDDDFPKEKSEDSVDMDSVDMDSETTDVEPETKGPDHVSDLPEDTELDVDVESPEVEIKEEMEPEGDIETTIEEPGMDLSIEEPMPLHEGPENPEGVVDILVQGLEDLANALKGKFTEAPAIDVEIDSPKPMDVEIDSPEEVSVDEIEPMIEPENKEEIEETPEFHDEATETPEEEAAETPEMQKAEAEAGVEEHGDEVPGIPEDLEEDEPLEKEGLEHTLMAMKNRTIRRSSEAMDDLVKGIWAQAMQAKKAEKSNDDVKKLKYDSGAKEKKVTVKPSQEVTEVKYKDGKTMGGEESFDKGVSKPDVPRGKATMGAEGNDLTVDEKGDMPSVPAGSGNLEGEENFEAEKDVLVDGNQGGQKA